jgi:hypothetical protein
MDVKETQAGIEDTRQTWVAPSFERLPLNEAMTGSTKTSHTPDGIGTYT